MKLNKLYITGAVISLSMAVTACGSSTNRTINANGANKTKTSTAADQYKKKYAQFMKYSSDQLYDVFRNGNVDDMDVAYDVLQVKTSDPRDIQSHLGDISSKVSEDLDTQKAELVEADPNNEGIAGNDSRSNIKSLQARFDKISVLKAKVDSWVAVNNNLPLDDELPPEDLPTPEVAPKTSAPALK